MDINKVIFKVIRILISITFFLMIVYGLMRIGMTAFDFGYRVFTESAIDEEPGTAFQVTIEEDMSSFEIGELLYQKGLVRDAKFFALQHILSAYADSILPGTYYLNTAMTPKEMMICMSDANEQVGQAASSESEEMTEEAETTEILEDSEMVSE